jgi:hypothetical protein
MDLVGIMRNQPPFVRFPVNDPGFADNIFSGQIGPVV